MSACGINQGDDSKDSAYSERPVSGGRYSCASRTAERHYIHSQYSALPLSIAAIVETVFPNPWRAD